MKTPNVPTGKVPENEAKNQEEDSGSVFRIVWTGLKKKSMKAHSFSHANVCVCVCVSGSVSRRKGIF